MPGLTLVGADPQWWVRASLHSSIQTAVHQDCSVRLQKELVNYKGAIQIGIFNSFVGNANAQSLQKHQHRSLPNYIMNYYFHTLYLVSYLKFINNLPCTNQKEKCIHNVYQYFLLPIMH